MNASKSAQQARARGATSRNRLDRAGKATHRPIIRFCEETPLSYHAPLDDLGFILNDYLRLATRSNLPGFGDATPDLIQAILSEAARISENVIHPLNSVADREGCTYDVASKSVRTPSGFAQAYQTFIAGGWPALSTDPADGGQGLPHVVSMAVAEMFASACWAFTMYPLLGHGAYAAIRAHGSDNLKRLYLPKLSSGDWTGTMDLTEPHAGTDLGMLRTTAVASGDGTYRITGSKIFISGGEQDLSANIVHLVLAKVPGGPPGSRGISLFLVPKFIPNADGSLGERNRMFCGGIEHKMGINGSATCQMHYEDATGWLIGEEHKGLRAMFTMMNRERLDVGGTGLSIAEVAYQYAAEWAKERLQGRSPSGAKNPDGPADPIIVQPDVRRLLMDVRAFNEGARGLILWTALQGDLEERAEDPAEREAAGDLMALLTPVIKAYYSDQGFYSAVKCQQVFGGAGYIKDYPAEQFVRDARIGMIYEGANGVQAMDLVGRKLPANGGRSLKVFLGEIERTLAEAKANDFLKPWVDGLGGARANLTAATQWLMQHGLAEPDNAGAAATDYLYIVALTALALIWLGLVKTAKAKLDEGTGNAAFCENKIATGRYFLARVLPDTAAHLAKLKSGAAPVMALADDQF